MTSWKLALPKAMGRKHAGGAAGSQVVISSQPIHHPHPIQPTSMIILSQGAYAKYVPALAPGGILLIDDELVTFTPDHRKDITIYGISATKIATGRQQPGCQYSHAWVLDRDCYFESGGHAPVCSRIRPPKTVSLNLEVFDIGYNQGLNAVEAKS